MSSSSSHPELSVSIDPDVFVSEPRYVAVVIVARGVRVGALQDGFAARLAEFVRVSIGGLDVDSLAQDPRVASWRTAYSAFGSKPSRYRNSLESLIRRAAREGLPSVNPLVDIYNAVSVKHMVPIGGEDLDRVQGEVRLRVAAGDEPFDQTWGGSEDPVCAGEVVWQDSLGVTCRRWNWRQSARTALTENTTNAYFVLDCLPPITAEHRSDAARQLTDLLTELDPTARISAATLDIAAPSVTL